MFDMTYPPPFAAVTTKGDITFVVGNPKPTNRLTWNESACILPSAGDEKLPNSHLSTWVLPQGSVDSWPQLKFCFKRSNQKKKHRLKTQVEKHRKKALEKTLVDQIGDLCFSKNESQQSNNHACWCKKKRLRLFEKTYVGSCWRKLISLTLLTPSQRRIWVGQYNLPEIYKIITTRKTKIQRFWSVQLGFRQPERV